MQLTTVKTTPNKVRLLLQGPSGSGKTYTALLLAYGLCGAYERIAIVDTDDGAAELYGYFGPYNTLSIGAPFNSHKFIDAVELCERAGIEVVVIDTLSAEWTGSGGVLEDFNVEDGDEALLRHDSLIAALKSCKCHVIATLQTEEAYHLSIVNGKREVEKYGLKPHQKEDIHYHFHTVLALNMKHKAKSLKDRTSFFEEHNSVTVTEEIAALYARWCGESNKGKVSPELVERINSCKSMKELLELMYGNEPENAATMDAFSRRRLQLEAAAENPVLFTQKHSSNGTDNYRATA